MKGKNISDKVIVVNYSYGVVNDTVQAASLAGSTCSNEGLSCSSLSSKRCWMGYLHHLDTDRLRGHFLPRPVVALARPNILGYVPTSSTSTAAIPLYS